MEKNNFFRILIVAWSVYSSNLLANEVFHVEKNSYPQWLKFDTVVQAVNQSTLSAQISGRVMATYFDIGHEVAKDRVILRLIDTEQQASYQKSLSNEQAAKITFQNAQREYQRIIGIYQKSLVSESILDQAKATSESSEALWHAAEAQLKSAQEQLNYTEVRAPFSGVVTKRHIEVGETVQPGTPLYTGVSLEQLRLVTEIPQHFMDEIRSQSQAQLRLDDGSWNDIDKNSLNFFTFADPQTGSFQVRITLPQDPKGFYPGMHFLVQFKLGEKNILSIPKNCVIQRGEVSAVQLQMKSQTQFQQVQLGELLTGNTVEILSGLEEGADILCSDESAHLLNQS